VQARAVKRLEISAGFEEQRLERQRAENHTDEMAAGKCSAHDAPPQLTRSLSDVAHLADGWRASKQWSFGTFSSAMIN